MLYRVFRAVFFQHSMSNNFRSVSVNKLYSKDVKPPDNFAPKHAVDQMDYIRSEIQNSNIAWPSLKENVLSKFGSINEKNFEGVLLRTMVNHKKFEAAVSFANYLKTVKSGEEMTLGAINGLLHLFYSLSLTRELSKEEKSFILDNYKRLYDKYKVLDFVTCEKLVHALCSIGEWEKALQALENLKLSSVPSHSAYSTIIGTLFKLNKKKKALELINQSIEDKRPLQNIAFEEWINYILRKYKDKKVILKHLQEIYIHMSTNYTVIDEKTANRLIDTFTMLGWEAKTTKIRKQNGECTNCKETLSLQKVSDEEFLLLQQNVKQKLIVGSDLFLKSSPEELQKFLKFVERTAPYDVVIDALNVAYHAKGSNAAKLGLLTAVVDYFKGKNKKILLLGRQHMHSWGKRQIEMLKSRTCSFFTDDISQDDPYFLTAAILSGPHTDIVSKDLLRTHKFQMKDEQLGRIFRRWQWQHQWMVFTTLSRHLKIQPPLPFTPCAQMKNSNWHLPYKKDVVEEGPVAFVNDGVPDMSSWLCLRPSIANSVK